MRCDHPVLRFHSGGHYVQCDKCKAWWIATKDAHTSMENIDFDRSSNSEVTGGEARIRLGYRLET